MLREGLRLIEERDAREAARLEALREAARIGFADIDEGRYKDLAENELDEIIEEFGRQASARLRDRAQ